MEEIEAADVLDRLMAAVGAENDNQLSAKTGVAQTTISTWRKRNKVPYDLCVNISKKYAVTLDFLVFGWPLPPEKEQQAIETIDIGRIIPEVFRSCWQIGEKVVAKSPSLDIRDVVIMLYNDSVLKYASSKAGKRQTIEQLLLLMGMMDEIFPPDYAAIAKAIEAKLKKLPGGSLFSHPDDGIE